MHVVLAQLDDLAGITVPNVSGPGYFFKRLYDLAVRLPEANYVAIAISLLAMTFIVSGKDILSPLLVRKFGLKIPIPYELILVIISTAISGLFAFNKSYEIAIVGAIPAGLTYPSLPRMDIFPTCLLNALALGVVTIAVHITMARLIAKKLNYKIDDNQELYALGFSDVLGGLFPVYPVATALGRTQVNVSSGTKTQLSTVFSCSLLLAVILWLGPLLETLPKCVLASIITVSFRKLYTKFEEIRTLWGICKIDAMVWVWAFCTTTFIDVMEGLGLSIFFVLLTVVFRTQWPKWQFTLSSSTKTEKDESPICVFSFSAPLIFTNITRFRKSLDTNINDWNDENKIVKELKSQHYTVYFAGVEASILQILENCSFFSILRKDNFFPTLHDAFSISRRNVDAVHMLSEAMVKRDFSLQLQSPNKNIDTFLALGSHSPIVRLSSGASTPTKNK